jgi:hypothetical protein
VLLGEAICYYYLLLIVNVIDTPPQKRTIDEILETSAKALTRFNKEQLRLLLLHWRLPDRLRIMHGYINEGRGSFRYFGKSNKEVCWREDHKAAEKTLKELISYLSESGKSHISKVSKQESLILANVILLDKSFKNNVSSGKVPFKP